ncbi:MAG: DUF2779 domain-containing protein [Gemmatimonadales bacterium]
MAPNLSKSRFVAGWQCHKQLWLRVHEADAPELQVDIVLQDRFDQGAEVGALARTHFPGGVLIDQPHNDPDRVGATRRALDLGATAVFEATFIEGRVYVAIDVLQRTAEGFTLIEVKSSTKSKDEHIPDVAIQTWVARRAGIHVCRAEVMHLNTDFRHPDHGELFGRTDVTDEVEAMQPLIPGLIEGQLAALAGTEPVVPVGTQCWMIDRDCPFWDRCFPTDENHVWTLYRAYTKQKWALVLKGISRVLDLPSDYKYSEIQRRQRKALETGRMIVETGLRQALCDFDCRLGFLDFETVGRAIPVWPDVGPWRQVVVQFSYHEQAPGAPDGHSHQAYLAEGPGDPREELALRMLEATRNAERIVMYSAFERTQIRELAKWLPHLAADLTTLEGKLIDLLPVIQKNVYHPRFAGSFSIKQVLNPMVPDLTYNDLAIVDGMVASVEIARLIFVAHKVKDRDQLRRDRLAYCERDTWAMVRQLASLRHVANEVPV